MALEEPNRNQHTSNAPSQPPPPQDASDSATSGTSRRKKRRWGNVSTATTPESTSSQSTSTPALTGASALTDPKAKLKAMQESIQARLAAAKAAAAGPSAPTTTTTATSGSAAPQPPSARVAALQQSIQARLAAAKQQQQQQQSVSSSLPQERPSKRAKQYELDLSATTPTFATATTASSQPLGSSKEESAAVGVVSSKPAPPANLYLAHQADEAAEDFEVVDDRLVDASSKAKKKNQHSRPLKFVEPGKWQDIARRQREKAATLAASGFLSGRKTGHSIQAHTIGVAQDGGDGNEANIYGPSGGGNADDTTAATDVLPQRWDAHTDTTMPLTLEWWDVELLPTKLKKQVGKAEAAVLQQQSKAALLQNLKKPPPSSKDNDDEGDDQKPAAQLRESDLAELRNTCWEQAGLFHCKTADLVQHIVPIQPPEAASATSAPQPVLHLTQKERKRQRKLRREEKQRELQDLQAAGLIPAPEPRLTLQNFIQVLGDVAFLDPSKYEQKVIEQMQARQQAHEQRNLSNKLTKEQRAQKVASKVQTQADTAAESAQIHTALFYVKNLQHPYHRTKLDLNAQQLLLTGGVLECPSASVACVIAEGSAKSVQKFVRLMTVRMTWTSGPESTAAMQDDKDGHLDMDDDPTDPQQEQHAFDPTNRCVLVWQGLHTKRNFLHFSFQSTDTPEQCRKILKQKKLEHLWDQVLHTAASDGRVVLKLGAGNATTVGTEAEKDGDGDTKMAT